MKCFVGIDLGSTTTKAVVLDDDGEVLGRGITNTRCNYDIAAAVAKQEALVDARFTLFRRGARGRAGARRAGRRVPRRARAPLPPRAVPGAAARPRGDCVAQQPRALRFAGQAKALAQALDEVFAPAPRGVGGALRARRAPQVATSSATSPARGIIAHRRAAAQGGRHVVRPLLDVSTSRSSRWRTGRRRPRSSGKFLQGARQRVAAADWRRSAGATARASAGRAPRSTSPLEEAYVRRHRLRARAPAVPEGADPLRDPLPRARRAHHVSRARARCSTSAARTRRRSRSTRTASSTSFQMNDRCAAGCGRYLGYIADEMNLGLHELGPLAHAGDAARCGSTRPAPCSPAPSCATGSRSARSARTSSPGCTARSSCARCRSLARSGGIRDQFTFTGGVAKNVAAVRELEHARGGELRRRHASTSSRTRSTRARSAARALRPARGRGLKAEEKPMTDHRRHRRRHRAREGGRCSTVDEAASSAGSPAVERIRQRRPDAARARRLSTRVLAEAGVSRGGRRLRRHDRRRRARRRSAPATSTG